MINDNQCKKCRRAGKKLFLKGERCFTPKCAIVKRSYAPGMHGLRRRSVSEYGRQLSEKQALRHIYGLSEKQFSNSMQRALREKGDTRENLMRKLELRLDNVVFRSGWTKSRILARQIVNHGHILVNKRKVDIPSYQVKVNDSIALKESSKKSSLFGDLKNSLKKYQSPAWLVSDKEKLTVKIVHLPLADDLGDLSEIGTIIEYYSR